MSWPRTIVAVLATLTFFVGPTARATSCNIKRYSVRQARGVIVGAAGMDFRVSGARVTLKRGSSKDPVVATAITDDRGRFRLAQQPVGDYVVEAEAPGFQPGFILIRITESADNRKEIVIPLMAGTYPSTCGGSTTILPK